ncbi:hypothetical protein ID853_05715 [Xenorhabdus sp. Vera]|uniref:hypothetical protein n=1 Tax=Xenorhabdus koppenhoeferi TaxID=351659 RepID=UPI0019B40636|nr:hypothetical protein [Xenorhabdus sp. Vera]MBD2810394.1 hypothetical protein [Xenorhabdus sp. Vera]
MTNATMGISTTVDLHAGQMGANGNLHHAGNKGYQGVKRAFKSHLCNLLILRNSITVPEINKIKVLCDTPLYLFEFYDNSNLSHLHHFGITTS